MKSQVLHTVWCNVSGEAAGEILNWSLLGVKGLAALRGDESAWESLLFDRKLSCILIDFEYVQFLYGIDSVSNRS